MSIYHDLLASLEPGLKAEAVIIGAHITAVRSGSRVGLSTTLHGQGHPHGRPTLREPDALESRTLAELAELVNSKLPMESSLGMAAINAGLPLQDQELKELNALDLLMERARERDLVMVGHFSFVKKLEETGAAVLGMSALVTAAFAPMQEVMRMLEDRGLRKGVHVVIGGGVTTPDMARRMGIDSQTQDAYEGLRIVKSVLKKEVKARATV